jgi:hypothetical protein
MKDISQAADAVAKERAMAMSNTIEVSLFTLPGTISPFESVTASAYEYTVALLKKLFVAVVSSPLATIFKNSEAPLGASTVIGTTRALIYSL